MFWQKIRKVSNRYVIIIPQEEIDRLQLADGQLVSLEIRAAEIEPATSPDLLNAFEESWRQNEQTYRYLAEN
ncbi:MAG TPA: hypothetical protein VKT25_10375 [Ktedonobacteraceae bacterium]|nr:hypothetical protein [Ktedonobacteraceae bacterium]